MVTNMFHFLQIIQFAINNCDTLIQDKDVAISIQYYTTDKQDTNIHNPIPTDGLASSKPK